MTPQKRPQSPKNTQISKKFRWGVPPPIHREVIRSVDGSEINIRFQNVQCNMPMGALDMWMVDLQSLHMTRFALGVDVRASSRDVARGGQTL